MVDATEFGSYRSTLETARALKLSEQRVRQLLDAGALASVRTSLGRLVAPAEIERYAAARAAKLAGRRGGNDA